MKVAQVTQPIARASCNNLEQWASSRRRLVLGLVTDTKQLFLTYRQCVCVCVGLCQSQGCAEVTWAATLLPSLCLTMAAAILDNATYTAASSVTTQTLPGSLNWHQQCVNLSHDNAIRPDTTDLSHLSAICNNIKRKVVFLWILYSFFPTALMFGVTN